MGEAFVYTLMAQYNTVIRKESGYGSADRLLDLPTNEAWIDPWVAHLRRLGVRLHLGAEVERLVLRGGRIVEAIVRHGDGGRERIEADWYVLAVPVERAIPLLDRPILSADPRLEGLGAR